MKKKNPFLRILAGLVGGILGYAIVSSMYEAGRNKSHLDSSLVQVAETMNKKLPMMVDAETRLEKVAASPGKLTYFFTLPNQSKDSVNQIFLKNELRPSLVGNYKTNGAMEAMRQQGVVLDYRYKDKNGELVFETTVSPKDF